MADINEKSAAFLGGMFEAPIDLVRYGGALPAAKVMSMLDPYSKSQVGGPDTLSLARAGIHDYYDKVPRELLGDDVANFRAEMMNKHPTTATLGEIVASSYLPERAIMRSPKPFMRFSPIDGRLRVNRAAQGLAAAATTIPPTIVEFGIEPAIDWATK